YDEFMRTCPQFERMLVRSGIVLIKYWLSVSDEEQERRFLGRINDPSKRWKLSPMDLQARARWVDYSEAKDQMFSFCDIKEAPWHVVETDNKRAAHLNLISHFLSLIPHEEVPHEDIKLPPRQKRSYSRPPKSSQRKVPLKYEVEEIVKGRDLPPGQLLSVDPETSVAEVARRMRTGDLDSLGVMSGGRRAGIITGGD